MSNRMHADEVETDADLVRRLLAAQFPQWADLPIERADSAGTVNAIYRLGDDMAVRLPLVARWADSLLKEQRWLPELAPQLPIPIPEPLARGEPGQGYPFPWGVYRWLAGVTWVHERVADERQAAADLAHFVTALRQVDPDGGPPSGRSKPLARRDTETRDAIRSLRGVLDVEVATAAWDQCLEAPAWDGTPVWIHGDLLPTNILVHNGRLSAVIDFGGAGLGDPACDLMAAWSLFSPEARAVYRSALNADEATWLRGRGWALSVAVLIMPYYRHTNPVFVAVAADIVSEVLADHLRVS